MYRIISAALFFVVLNTSISAQEKMLTIEDASYMNRALFPKSMSNLAWRGDSHDIAYVENNALISMKSSGTTRDTILNLDMLNKEFNLAGLDSLRRFPRAVWESENIFRFTSNQTIFTYNLKKEMLSEENSYPKEAETTDLHQNTKNVAYTIGNDLYIAVSGQQIQITNDEDEGIINGQTVHRNEFGISKGTFWSPDGDMLAFYRKDESMVSDYPLVDIDTRPGTTNSIKYPMAGMTSEQVTLGVYHIEEQKTVFIKTGEPVEQYLTNISWGPEGAFVYIAVLNRDQNHLKLNKYDVNTGDFVKTLFEETNEKYVEPEHPLYFLENEPSQFFWMSERDGYQHLYLYNTDGELIKQLTSGDWIVTQYLGTDKSTKEVYFSCTKESPLNRDICAADIKSGEIRNVTLNPGTHRLIPSADRTRFIDIFSDRFTVREYSVITKKGKVLQHLLSSPNPLADYGIGVTNLIKLTANDGSDLHCRIIYPPDFDHEKQYPSIVYVYGGPHAQLVTNSWLCGASLFLQYLAQQGYIVFTLDNRGSANRGRDFEQALFRKMGSVEIDDQMKGVEFLKQQSYIDPDRMGVHGWSYGGFMTISLMLKQADQFKAGVCGGPVTDWKYYEIMYGERYMDTPESNPTGYADASLLDKTENLKGNLLIIHGTHDPVVVWQHSLDLIDRFIKSGKLVDYFVYPGHGHGVGGRDRVHLNMKMADYFKKNL